MARDQQRDRKDEVMDGGSTIGTVVEKASDAVSAMGSGRRRLPRRWPRTRCSQPPEPRQVPPWAGPLSLASASRRPRSRPRRGDHPRSDPRARKRRRRVARGSLRRGSLRQGSLRRGSLRQGSRPRGHRRPRRPLPRRLLQGRLLQGRAARGPRPRASGRHPRRRNEAARSDNSSMVSLPAH